MSEMNRRQFIKTVSVAFGAAAITGAVPAVAEVKTSEGVKSSGSQVSYEVFALKYAGPFDRKLAMIMFNTGWSEDIAINYYIWAIRSKDGETTLVDTGTGPTLAKERGFKGFVPPEQMVARLGIKPEQVTKVIITHMHFDHVGGMENFPQLYPQAKFYVQKNEFDFWVNNPIAKRAPFKGLRWESRQQGVGRSIWESASRGCGRRHGHQARDGTTFDPRSYACSPGSIGEYCQGTRGRCLR